MESLMRKKDEIELSLLKRFGLRHSILAAWDESLREKGIAVPRDVEKLLARARVKISSGCFTACDVGSDLGRIEGILISTAATAGEASSESWLDMLAECMSEKADIGAIEKKILFPHIETHYNRFNFDGACGQEESTEA